MSENKLTPDQLQALLQYASKMLGTSPENLVNSVNKSGPDAITSKLSGADAAKFQAVLRDKDKLEQLMSSPQAQQLLSKLLKNK